MENEKITQCEKTVYVYHDTDYDNVEAAREAKARNYLMDATNVTGPYLIYNDDATSIYTFLCLIKKYRSVIKTVYDILDGIHDIPEEYEDVWSSYQKNMKMCGTAISGRGRPNPIRRAK